MKTLISLSIALLFTITGCAQSLNNISVQELEKVMKTNIVLIDVRTESEYQEVHLENAVNIDWYAASFMEQMRRFDKQTPIYLYCRSGKRSTMAAQKLVESGYTRVYSLEGGMNEWQNSHKTVRK